MSLNLPVRTHQSRESNDIKRPITTVNGIPFYWSTGLNSGHQGTPFPFGGFNLEGDDSRGRGWMIKPANIQRFPILVLQKLQELFPGDHAIAPRFGTVPCLLISSVLGGGLWNEPRGQELKRFLQEYYPHFYQHCGTLKPNEVEHTYRHNEYEQVDNWLVSQANVSDWKQLLYHIPQNVSQLVLPLRATAPSAAQLRSYVESYNANGDDLIESQGCMEMGINQADPSQIFNYLIKQGTKLNEGLIAKIKNYGTYSEIYKKLEQTITAFNTYSQDNLRRLTLNPQSLQREFHQLVKEGKNKGALCLLAHGAQLDAATMNLLRDERFKIANPKTVEAFKPYVSAYLNSHHSENAESNPIPAPRSTVSRPIESQPAPIRFMRPADPQIELARCVNQGLQIAALKALRQGARLTDDLIQKITDPTYRVQHPKTYNALAGHLPVSERRRAQP
jgi:hypothetical protein